MFSPTHPLSAYQKEPPLLALLLLLFCPLNVTWMRETESLRLPLTTLPSALFSSAPRFPFKSRQKEEGRGRGWLLSPPVCCLKQQPLWVC